MNILEEIEEYIVDTNSHFQQLEEKSFYLHSIEDEVEKTETFVLSIYYAPADFLRQFHFTKFFTGDTIAKFNTIEIDEPDEEIIADLLTFAVKVERNRFISFLDRLLKQYSSEIVNCF